MVSFCDMMTLILTFFILLVSMSREQQAGLVADGVGSFIVAIRTHGLDGIMSGQEKAAIYEHQRRKFNVPPEEDPERMTEVDQSSHFELIKTKLLDALESHDELRFGPVVEFAPDSAEIPVDSLPYLDRLAPSLYPKFRQILLIEGHAGDAGPRYSGDSRQLANARAQAIRSYLIEEFKFAPERVQARAWNTEVPTDGQANRSIDIRLVTPRAKSADK
jgi:flagellar motor protein MotB